MSTVQSDGVSSVTAVSTDNNGGTIKANGTVSGTFAASSLTQVDTGVFASTVVDNNDADKALSTGTFAFNNNSPVAKKLTGSLSGVNNDFLLSGASDPNNIQSIHKIESVRTRRLTSAIRQNKWNEYSGEFDSGFPVVAVDNFGADDAANPTRSVPGELVYRTGSPNVVQDNYKKKTS
jgi:hypothetical protein